VSFFAALIYPLTSTFYYHHTLARYDEFSQFDFDGTLADCISLFL